MKKPLATLAAATALLSTAFLLLADSARQCTHPAEQQPFFAIGDCGFSGPITLRSGQDLCALTVENGGAVGLPETGEVGPSMKLAVLDWWLSDTVLLPVQSEDGGFEPDGGMVEAWRHCSFPDDGGTLLECFVVGEDGPRCRYSLQAL